MRINTKSIYKGSNADNPKIVSVSLFRMKNSYMGFPKYLDFCIKFIEQVKRILPDWTLRIYVDESVKEDELEKLMVEHVEIVEYKCDDFWNESTGTHEGTFGTFMRFLPFFSAQKYECMVSSDIDVGDFMLEYFRYFDKHAEQIGLINQICYNEWIPEDLNYSILAGGIFSRVVFPRSILTNFLKKVKDGKISVKITKQTDQDTYVPYGTDEYFLTTELYTYLESNKVKVMTLTVATVVGAMRKVLKSLENDDERKTKADKYLKKLTYLDQQFWKDPRLLKPDSFNKYLEPLIKLIKPELDKSRHKKCIMDYLDHPKMVRLHRYNY